MSMLDVVGPVMVGPSSSHTLGALKIARFAYKLLKNIPDEVEFFLHGSFSTTYHGHGSDKALLAGIMGYREYDYEIRDAYEIAKRMKLKYSFIPTDLGDVHPNTILIKMRVKNTNYAIRGASIGGGSIEINEINGVQCSLNGNFDALITVTQDRPRVLENILKLIHVNIANLYLRRVGALENKAVTIIELDSRPENLEELKNVKYIQGYYYVERDI
jgi:L-serine dehydratase